MSTHLAESVTAGLLTFDVPICHTALGRGHVWKHRGRSLGRGRLSFVSVKHAKFARFGAFTNKVQQKLPTYVERNYICSVLLNDHKTTNMNTITVNIARSNAVAEWMMKEEGSFEDHKKSPDHVYAILARCKGRTELTLAEADTLMKSGDYQQSWQDDEIGGGARTKQTIAGICKRVENAMRELV